MRENLLLLYLRFDDDRYDEQYQRRQKQERAQYRQGDGSEEHEQVQGIVLASMQIPGAVVYAQSGKYARYEERRA